MTVKNQVRARIAVGVMFVLAFVALALASLLGAYAASPESWITYIWCGISLTGGLYLINSARRLGKRAPEADTTKKE